MSNQPKNVNPTPEKTYYIPGHPNTPVFHDFFVEFMRPYRKRRKQLERDGLCNPAYGFVCTCDCVGCRYAITRNFVSTAVLEENGIEIDSGYRVEEASARNALKESLCDLVNKLDLLDRLIVYAKFYHEPAMTARQAAEYISRKIGKTYSHQAVSKRFPQVIARLYQLAAPELKE